MSTILMNLNMHSKTHVAWYKIMACYDIKPWDNEYICTYSWKNIFILLHEDWILQKENKPFCISISIPILNSVHFQAAAKLFISPLLSQLIGQITSLQTIMLSWKSHLASTCAVPCPCFWLKPIMRLPYQPLVQPYVSHTSHSHFCCIQ